jgi:hypothetical protein
VQARQDVLLLGPVQERLECETLGEILVKHSDIIEIFNLILMKITVII